LFLGDSSCNQGLRPDIWREATGATAVNLCTIGDMLATNDAWMLERYLARHGAPRGGVVVMHAYDVWHRGMSGAFRTQLLARVPLPWGFWERATPKVTLTRDEALSVAASRYAPLYSEHATLAKRLRPLSGEPSPQFALDADGYMRLDDAAPARVKRDVRGHLGFVRRKKPSVSRENREALARLRALAEEREFSLYLAASPIADELARDAEWRRHFDGVEGALAKAVEGSPRARLVLTTPATFPATRMENADHLVHEAAASYTKQVAEAVGASRTSATTPTNAAPESSASGTATSAACPGDMALVAGSYCPVVSQRCVDQPAVVGGQGHMQCQRFEKAKCIAPRRRDVRFCMDRYEWPNEKGALPRTLTSWLEARAMCAERGKRLCTEDEFNFACEGEAMSAYVYGDARDSTACNFDRPYIERTFTYTRWDSCMADPTCKAEFDRLDQRVPSGSMLRCVSQAGVFDLNGNVNEWVERTEPTATSRSGLKGGWWGPVRDRCRPMTTFHLAGDFGYEAGFRCCRDAG